MNLLMSLGGRAIITVLPRNDATDDEEDVGGDDDDKEDDVESDDFTAFTCIRACEGDVGVEEVSTMFTTFVL